MYQHSGFPARRAPIPLSEYATIGLFVFGLLAFLYVARPIMVPLVSAVVIGLLLGPTQGRLTRLGFPAWISSLLLVSAVIGFFIALTRLLFIPFEIWASRLPEIWSELKRQLDLWKGVILRLKDVKEEVEESAGIDESVERVVVDEPGFLADIAFSAPVAGGQLVIFVGALFFYLAGRDDIRARCLSLCVSRQARLTVARILRDMEFCVSHYLTTILLINIGLGVVTAIALWMIGFPNPILWGVLAALLNFAPYIGPLIVDVLLFGVGLLTYDSLVMAAAPMLIFFMINLVEANVVTPAIIGQTFTIQPLAVFVSLAIWVWMWGPVGALLSVPLLLIIEVILSRTVPGQTQSGRRSTGLSPAQPAR